MNGGTFKMLACLAAAGLVICCAGNALAKAKGACVNCHTMHNSQDGEAMATGDDGSALDTPVEALLAYQSCLACHTGSNTGITEGVMNGTGIPYVLDTTEPNYTNDEVEANAEGTSNTLAGGNFYWVDAGDDATGHNVDPISQDGKLGFVAPGFDADNFDINGSVTTGGTWDSQLTCAGTYGCHGTHDTESTFGAVRGAHHGDDSAIDGTSVVKSFRFLNGIVGKEDIDWEFTKTDTDHNQYKGSTSTDATTISYLCAECHGAFHTPQAANGEDGSAPWLRHPTDFDMNGTPATGTTEYADYNGGGTYSVEAPVASTDVTAVISNTTGAGKAIVTCLSCHRAHGSPYADLLRWDYDTMIAGNAGDATGKGCFVCHTTKD
jgi:Doubled CXXCH motif (Paired_CXXCH_1)